MEKTPQGTSVGVDDPYAVVERCDHLTDDGTCRYAAEHGHHDPEFARERHEDDLRCPVVDPESEAPRASGATDGSASGERTRSDGETRPEGASRERERGAERPASGAAREPGDPGAGEWAWRDCPHFRARQRSRECVRCGLEERRLAHEDERPLLEEHHLEYDDDARKDLAHEITVYICRWCHAKVHDSWARIDDDASPDPEAIAEAEGRRSREHEELGFETAAERVDDEIQGS